MSVAGITFGGLAIVFGLFGVFAASVGEYSASFAFLVWGTMFVSAASVLLKKRKAPEKKVCDGGCVDSSFGAEE